MISDKVRPHHLERKAILYVRQSSAHQVLHNRESSALQYGMRDRLTALGWSEIEVIDDDLGRSAAGGVQRAGFERMVAEVCLGKVGAVCAREVSRFARNSRDWQQLIEMCRVVDTVLVDQETIYAPRHGNDRSGSRAASTSTSWICCASARFRRATRRRAGVSWL
jgi:DNA invertase Pin-like site-specific DNA recombinase